MQRQLDKITDLVLLIVQKMEIRTEIGIEDKSKCDAKEKSTITQQLRPTINVARRMHRLRSATNNNVCNSVGHTNV